MGLSLKGRDNCGYDQRQKEWGPGIAPSAPSGFVQKLPTINITKGKTVGAAAPSASYGIHIFQVLVWRYYLVIKSHWVTYHCSRKHIT